MEPVMRQEGRAALPSAADSRASAARLYTGFSRFVQETQGNGRSVRDCATVSARRLCQGRTTCRAVRYRWNPLTGPSIL